MSDPVLLTEALYERLLDTEGVQPVFLTADMAKFIQSKADPTVNFRKINRAKVNLLVSYIHTCQWFGSLAQVHLDRAGNVVNGQHTLAAIAEAGQMVEVNIFFGVPNEADDYFDAQSQGRTNAQHMTSLGYGFSGAASVVSIVHAYYHDGELKGRNPQGDRKWLTKAVDETPAFRKYAKIANEIVKTYPIVVGKTRYSGAPLRAAAILFLNEGHSEETVREFFAGLAGMQTSGKGSVDARLKTVQTLAELPNISTATSNDKAMMVLLHGFRKWVLDEECRNVFPIGKLTSRHIPAPR